MRQQRFVRVIGAAMAAASVAAMGAVLVVGGTAHGSEAAPAISVSVSARINDAPADHGWDTPAP